MENTKKGYSDKQFFKPNVKSDLIKKMLKDSALSQNDLADYLNCTLSSLRNKFTRDSFSLYDFIIICHVCGYSLSICNGDIGDNLNNAMDCVDSIVKNIRMGDEDIDQVLDDAELAQENLESYECTFDFSLENILTDEECHRIQDIQKKKSNDKYHKILNSLSENEQLAMLEILKSKQTSSE